MITMPRLSHLTLILVSALTSVTSNSPVRLVNGKNNCYGRVEILFNDIWGTVCDDSWDMNDAAVLCRQLGCGEAVSVHQSAHFGQGSGQIWLDDVDCSGSELSLSQCSHQPFGKHNCGHSEDAGVVCSKGVIRLVNGSDSCCGRVEILHNDTWGNVCDDSWDMNDAAVVCRQLGCGSAIGAPHSAAFGQGSGKIWLDDVGCSGSERNITQCSHRGLGKHNCRHREDAGVVCSVHLQQPNISHSASDGGFDVGLQGPVITWGHSFTIICSTQSQYPGGSFYLFRGSNIIRNQSADRHLTSFTFPEVDFSQEGNYTCVYEVSVCSYTLRSSASEPLLITITASLLPVIGAVVSALLLLLSVLIIVLLLKRRQKQSKEEGHLKCSFRKDAGNSSAIPSHDNKKEEDDDEAIYENVELVDNDHSEDDYVIVVADDSEMFYANVNENKSVVDKTKV